MDRKLLRIALFGALALAGLAFLLAGCGSGSGTGSESSGSSTSGSDQAGEQTKIAFLDGAVANTYLEATLEAIEEVAGKENAEVTVFDAQFDPSKQYAQFQNVLATKSYDAIVFDPLNGPAIKPLVEKALDEGIKVGSTNLPVGDDFTTTEPGVPGMSVAVQTPGITSGQRAGQLTVSACEGIDPCEVAYLFGLKSIPYDLAIREGFDAVIDKEPNIEVVAEAEGEFLANAALSATQNILQAHPDIDVLVAAGDQMALGAEKAIGDEDIKIIGIGGSIPAVEAIEAGRWFGTAVLLPHDEGRIVTEGVLNDIKDGSKTGGVDPVAKIPGDGLITSDNADQFTPQWKG